ncbi:hypothetical protein BDZ85DRAFT_63311 [Elsinoe ampelina]|uniref:Uncharacterized protein n=1 Tax=Elsinoe ampelina TaxID=302913 RepID=A0A6A6FZC1_9PEZI|nr:hypothetical protein BDZ85DRAFT_63311 [Elsinoe ampelina]
MALRSEKKRFIRAGPPRSQTASRSTSNTVISSMKPFPISRSSGTTSTCSLPNHPDPRPRYHPGSTISHMALTARQSQPTSSCPDLECLNISPALTSLNSDRHTSPCQQNSHHLGQLSGQVAISIGLTHATTPVQPSSIRGQHRAPCP